MVGYRVRGHQAVALDGAQGPGEHFLGDAVELPAQLPEAQGTVAQRADDQVAPFVGQHVEHRPRGAAAQVHVGRLAAPSRRLAVKPARLDHAPAGG